MTGKSELPVTPLKVKNQRLSELVKDQLLEWIMNGTLVMGQRISEDELAEKLGVSRMPVREGLRLMEGMSLVESIPYVGSRIKKLNADEIKEIYLLREILESTACQLAALRITEDEMRALEDTQHRLDMLADEPRTTELGKKLYQLNREFHMQIYAASRMPRLCEMIDNLWNNIAYFRMRSAATDTYVNRMQKEHTIYIEALRRRDGDTIQKCFSNNLQLHLSEFLEKEENDGAADADMLTGHVILNTLDRHTLDPACQ